MNSQDAHALLNAARSGLPVAANLISEALMATGDLTPPQRTYTAEYTPVVTRSSDLTAPAGKSEFERAARLMNETGQGEHGWVK